MVYKLASLLVLLALAGLAFTPAPQAEGGIRVAVVNLADCLSHEKYEGARMARETFQKLNERLVDDLKGIDERYAANEEKLKQLKEGENPSLFYDLRRQREMLSHEKEYTRKTAEKRLQLAERDLAVELYKEIVRITELVAKDRFDLILRVGTPLSQTETTMALYYAKGSKIDITEEVLRKLNEEFAKSKGAMPVPERTYRCDTCGTVNTEPRCPTCNKELKQSP